jgi:uncharacterized protein (DUF1499 family)
MSLLLLFQINIIKAEDMLIKDCADKPNCVSSVASRVKQKIEPIIYKGSMEDFQNVVKKVFEQMDNNTIVASNNGYIHSEFTSSFFKFVDDFELQYDLASSLIHLRSSSRVGYYDFGANQKRAEKFRLYLSNLSKGLSE